MKQVAQLKGQKYRALYSTVQYIPEYECRWRALELAMDSAVLEYNPTDDQGSSGVLDIFICDRGGGIMPGLSIYIVLRIFG
jgi:hypothetical protein